MGLDMYLKKYDKGMGNLIDGERAYWRKANQIRAWLVSKAGYPYGHNCEVYPLSKETLENLLSDCKKVLNDHSCAPQIMPTSEGFFFGSTEYDEDYFRDIEYTVDVLSEILEETDFNKETIAYFEWW